MPAVEGRDYLSMPYQGGGTGAGWGNALAGVMQSIIKAYTMKGEKEREDQDRSLKMELHKHNMSKLKAEQKLKELEGKTKGFDFMETQNRSTVHDPTALNGQVTVGAGDDPNAGSPGYGLNMPPPGTDSHAPMDFSGFSEMGIPEGLKIAPRTMQEKLQQDIEQKTKLKRANDITLPPSMRDMAGGAETIAPELVSVLDEMPSQVDPAIGKEFGFEPGKKYSKGDRDLAKTAFGDKEAMKRARLSATGADERADRIGPKEKFRMEGQLRDDFTREMKPFYGTDAAMAKMRAATEDPNGYDDASLIYGYNKLLDESSVVREGERDYIIKVGSIKNRVNAYAEQVSTGKQLSPAQRDELMKSADKLYMATQPIRQKAEGKYDATIKNYSLNPENIMGAQRGGPPRAAPGSDTPPPQPTRKQPLPNGKTRLFFPDGSYLDQ